MLFSRPIRSVTNLPGTTWIKMWPLDWVAPGLILGWAGANQIPILKPAPLIHCIWPLDLLIQELGCSFVSSGMVILLLTQQSAISANFLFKIYWKKSIPHLRLRLEGLTGLFSEWIVRTCDLFGLQFPIHFALVLVVESKLDLLEGSIKGFIRHIEHCLLILNYNVF